MERTVQVWIDNDYIELELEDNYDSEDKFYEAAVAYVYDNISIDVL